MLGIYTTKRKTRCALMNDCGFFGGGYKEHSLGEFLIREYCSVIPQFCAIHITQRAVGKDQVPEDLLPHELERVKCLL